MNRSSARLLIAITLAGYGSYQALHVPGLLTGAPAPLLLIGFVLQAVLGIAAGVGVWRGAHWAPFAIIMLGASIAATALIEAFVLGIVAYLRALAEAVVAIVATYLVAAYVRGKVSAVPAEGRCR